MAAGHATINSPSPIPSSATYSAPIGSATVDPIEPSFSDTSSQPFGAAAGVTQTTWYTADTVVDSDGDGQSDDLIFFVAGDTGSGDIDSVDISVGNAVFGEGNLTDGVVALGNDERKSGTGTFTLGNNRFTFELPSLDTVQTTSPFVIDSSHHVSSFYYRVQSPQLPWVQLEGPDLSELATIGGNQYDADGFPLLNSCVPNAGIFGNTANCPEGNIARFALTVCFDDIPLVKTCYPLSDGQRTFNAPGDLELLINEITYPGSGGPNPVTAGSWTVLVTVPETVVTGGSLASSQWYEGTLSVTIDQLVHSLPFVFVDTNSDGIHETLQIDEDQNGLFDTDEVFRSGETMSIGDSRFTIAFGGDPSTTDFILTWMQTPPEYPDHQNEAVGNPAIAALKNGEPPSPGELRALANMTVPGRPKPPSIADAIRTIDGQPLVANEIIVSVDLEHKDPEVLAKRIALALGGEISGAIPKARTYQMAIPADTPDLVDSLAADVAGVPGVEAAEAHWMVDKFGSRTPNDSFFGKPLPDKPYVAQWDMAFLNLPQVWDITTGSPSVPVAVIDADFDPAHSDLKVNVRKAFGDRSAAGGHGTHVAATACGAGDNGGGIAGVAWQCNLRIYDFGASSALMAQEAMIEAIDDGARIVNISAQWVDNNQCGKMGSPAIKKRAEQMNATFAPAIKYAQKQKKDVLWVLAAGNECRDTVYASPASLVKQFPDNVIVVASVDPDGRLSHFSNFGDLVDVAAPGGEILSAVPRKCNPDCKDSFELQSGTSMAAPHVTGVAALMRSANPGINAKKLKQCLLASASRPVGGQPFGIIDALSAVRCADG